MTNKKNRGHFDGSEGVPFTSESGSAASWKRHRDETLRKFGYHELLEDEDDEH